MELKGYVENLPIKPGDEITIPKGAVIFHRGETSPVKRTFRVKVHHVLNGYTPDAAEVAYQARHGRTNTGFNPRAIWVGTGGYWSEIDMNDIPEVQAV